MAWLTKKKQKTYVYEDGRLVTMMTNGGFSMIGDSVFHQRDDLTSVGPVTLWNWKALVTLFKSLNYRPVLMERGVAFKSGNLPRIDMNEVSKGLTFHARTEWDESLSCCLEGPVVDIDELHAFMEKVLDINNTLGSAICLCNGHGLQVYARLIGDPSLGESLVALRSGSSVPIIWFRWDDDQELFVISDGFRTWDHHSFLGRIEMLLDKYREGSR